MPLYNRKKINIRKLKKANNTSWKKLHLFLLIIRVEYHVVRENEIESLPAQ